MGENRDGKRLSLAFLDLAEIPPNIGPKQLRDVEVLDISNNQFSYPFQNDLFLLTGHALLDILSHKMKKCSTI